MRIVRRALEEVGLTENIYKFIDGRVWQPMNQTDRYKSVGSNPLYVDRIADTVDWIFD